MISEADVVIVVDGKIGTLNEFTLAFHFGKLRGSLGGSFDGGCGMAALWEALTEAPWRPDPRLPTRLPSQASPPPRYLE